MKNQLLVLLVITASVSANAQHLEVLATSGIFHKNSSGSLSWTLGEVTVETLIGTNFILTQGFQQSKLTVTAIDKLQTPSIELAVYPNPTNSFLFIVVKTEKERDLLLSLFDLNGKQILLKKISDNRLTFPMQNYKPATYILKVTKDGEAIKSYQIIKQ